MGSIKTAAPALALTVMMLALAACQGTRIPYLNTRTTAVEPLPAAPAGDVASDELPPPGGMQAGSSFPEAPATEDVPVDVAAASAPDIAKNSVVGSWKTLADGVNCQMFLTLTKYGDNSRGGTRGCSGDLERMRGWNVSGKLLVLYDESGNRIGSLYSTGQERFDGQTAGGQAISLSR